ncbi:hypothetical protein FDUTEX481_04003 [Tolypothrix sp. PCC 7601]|nr:hypothetical protein FDUTEX481_04003 [Tolypothrix sp. PCC 7601]
MVAIALVCFTPVKMFLSEFGKTHQSLMVTFEFWRCQSLIASAT